jgi:hypothetical protein
MALGDRLRGRELARTRTATIVALSYALLLTALIAVALTTSTYAFWPPLVLALPLFVLELAYDVRSRSRRLIPELVGTVGVGSVAAAIVLADGGEATLAYGLWGIAAARAVAAIPFVRVQLRRGKGQPHRLISSDSAQALAIVIALAVSPQLGWIPIIAILALGLFHVVAVRQAVPRTAILGAQQVVLGLTVVLVTALAVVAS